MTLWLVMGGSSGTVEEHRIDLGVEPCPTITAEGVGGSSGLRERRVDLSKTPCPTVMAQGLGGVQLTRGDTQFWLEDDEVKLVKHAPHSWAKEPEEIDLCANPCPAVMAGGIWGDNFSHYFFEPRGRMLERKNAGKPPYRVPPMAEVAAVPWNGLTVASTFTGAGGSCLGFRMAGFRTLWASEFVSAAAEVYRLNHPGVPLDARDIRNVRPEDVLAAAGKERGEIDVLEGSPPCASFSTAGRREATWGKVKKYSDTRQRVDDLFFEFARILDGLQPRTFVAENVSGLVKGKAKGYFKEILAALKACGYRVRVKLLDAQWLGVPQSRRRVIFAGVRNDLGAGPKHPTPLAYRYSVAEAIPWVLRQRHGRGFGDEEWIDGDEAPAQTVGTGPASGNNVNNGMYKVEAACVVEDTGGEWGMGDVTDRPAPTVRQGGVGHLYVERRVSHGTVDPDTGDDVSIGRYAIGREWDRLARGEKGKYFNFVKPRTGEPSPTICQATAEAFNPMACPSVVHPTVRRKFFISELKRICAFPDDFVLTGTYAQRWERMGRAVPPVMAFWIARSVREVLFKLDGRKPWLHDPPCLVAGLGRARG